MYFFYILKCKNDGSLYCGITNNLSARVKKHNSGSGSKYVRSRGGGRVVYYEKIRVKSTAMKREAEVKKWPKKQKQMLIFSRKEKKMPL